MIERATEVELYSYNSVTKEIVFKVLRKMYWISVTDVENGIATIWPYAGRTSFYDFYEVIIGCLNENSNFWQEVSKAYGNNEEQDFCGVKYYDGKRGIILRVEKDIR